MIKRLLLPCKLQEDWAETLKATMVMEVGDEGGFTGVMGEGEARTAKPNPWSGTI